MVVRGFSIFCVDDTALAPIDKERYKDLGTIKVLLQRVVRGKAVRKKQKDAAPLSDPATLGNEPINERVKKAGSHRISLVSELPSTAQRDSDLQTAA